MKRIIALILALLLCLSFTACASEDEKAFEAADALLAAGDYEGALKAFYAIELYGRTSEKIYEIEEHLRAEKLSFLTGTWVDIRSGNVMTFGEAGSFEVTTEYGDGWDGEAWYDDNGDLYINGLTTIEEIDGVTHMISDYNDWVPEENYEQFAAQEVEITLENWEQYFELRDAKSVHTNGFGEIENVSMGYGIFLREEYVDKLDGQYDAVDVSFKLQYVSDFRYIAGDFPDGEYAIGGKYPHGWEDGETKEEVREVYYSEYEGIEKSDFYGKYAADFCTGYVYNYNEDQEPYVDLPTEGTVIAVTGTIKIFP